MVALKENRRHSKKGRLVGRKRTRKPPKSLTPWERRVAAHLGELIGDRAGQVADAVGVSHDAVLKWCAGESFPSVDKWLKLANALGLDSPRELLPLK